MIQRFVLNGQERHLYWPVANSTSTIAQCLSFRQLLSLSVLSSFGGFALPVPNRVVRRSEPL